MHEDDDAPMVTIPDNWATDILTFWFIDHGRADWFGGGPAFDAAITARFGDWWHGLRSQPVQKFTAHADTALAAIILFDQMPRNIFRGSANAFATDHLALAIARDIVATGSDARLSADRRIFAYLPFEHSEDLADQRESIRLIGALGNADYLDFAQKHFAIIEQFGRFPHRNAVLGRADRPGEDAAIRAGGQW